jgi:ClpP class serine protease
LALDPQAFGLEFVLGFHPAQPYTLAAGDRVAVVDIKGPLVADPGPLPLFDSYPEIQKRVAAAFESPAECVVLRVASPGGEVYGAFDCARALRQLAAAAGKDLIVHTSANCCSSAYALSSAASRIVCSDTACVGSIGVIATYTDVRKADATAGIAYTFLTSGPRKADGNPHVGLDDDAIKALQLAVDETAQVFFGLVHTHRPGIDDPAGLKAGVFVGASAQAIGLVDDVMSWDALIASLTSADADPTTQKQGTAANVQGAKVDDESDDDKDKNDATRAELVKASESDDKKKAARAKRALAAYDESDDKDAAAEDDDKDAASPDEDKDASRAAAFGGANGLAAVGTELIKANAEISRLKAKDAARDKRERAELYAGRPDMPEVLRKTLDTMSVEQVRGVLAGLPAPAAGFVNPHTPAATAAAGAARGASQTGAADDTDRLPPEAAAQLDAQMGIAPLQHVNRLEGTVFQLGVPVRMAAPSAAPKG